jgi:MoaA/NifB/PqqE/SkfB family radical SAM enzyme
VTALSRRISEALNGLYRALRVYGHNRSLKAWGVLALHLVRKAFDRTVPTYLVLSLTHLCQCRCVHCCQRQAVRDDRAELTAEEVKSLIDQARRLGAIYVVFAGGEPLMRKDIVELVGHAHRRGLISRINTNGLLFTPELVALLKKAGLTQAGVSIDSPDAEIHDRLRGLPGAFDTALEGIRNLQRRGILVQLMTYASRENIPEGLRRLISLGRELGVFYIYFFFPTASGAWICAFNELLTEEEKTRVRELADVRYVHVELATRRSLCRVSARSVMNVSPYGDLTPCPFVPYVIGNVRSRPLKEFWRPFAAGLKLRFKGDCAMNNVANREALKAFIDAAAGSPDR